MEHGTRGGHFRSMVSREVLHRRENDFLIQSRCLTSIMRELEKNYIYNLVYVRRTSCCKKRIDRVKKVYKHELQSSIDTVFSTAPAFFQLFILIANIFYAVCLLVQSRHAEGTRFSFSRSFARNYHPFLSREEN